MSSCPHGQAPKLQARHCSRQSGNLRSIRCHCPLWVRACEEVHLVRKVPLARQARSQGLWLDLLPLGLCHACCHFLGPSRPSLDLEHGLELPPELEALKDAV